MTAPSSLADRAVALCVLVLTGIAIARYVEGKESTPEPIEIARWAEIRTAGRPLFGSRNASAPVEIVEFGDYECPFCRVFHATLEELKARYRDTVSVRYVHLPLGMHEHAREAAVAAECAAGFGQFEEMHAQLFRRQDSIGILTFEEMGRRAGVVDTASFTKCMAAPEAAASVDSQAQLARSVQLQSTPTVIVNGYRLLGTPGVAYLDSVVRAAIKGDPPPR